MTKTQHDNLKVGDILIVTQHGKDRGKLCTVICPRPNYRGVHVRLIKDGEFFIQTNSNERIMAHESLGFADSIPTFSFVISATREPEVTIAGKKLALVALTYNWATKTDRVGGPNIAIASGYLDEEFELRIFYLNIDAGTVTEI